MSALCALAAFGFIGWVVWPIDSRLLEPHATGLRIEDRHGIPLRSTRAADGSRARWTSVAEMDSDLLLAFVAVEDKRFWSHHGVDPVAAGRAFLANRKAGRIVSGASTIPMQLARLLQPGSRGWRSKFRETAWGIRLNWQLNKEELLEQYLNRVHLGQGAVGVTAAAQLYFGTSVHELGVGEAAMLAGLAHAPSRDNPFSSPSAARARRRVALERMQRASMISTAELERASVEPVMERSAGSAFLAPHFTTRLVQLDSRGAFESLRTERVWRSTLDAELQREIEGEVQHAVSVLRLRAVRQAAAVVIDNVSGDILAWVGSPDFWEPRHGQTDMVVSARQPGSALKPFLYALAFDRGVSAATVLPDVPLSYATPTGAYSPRNYDRRFRGPVRAREALASSYNVPAVELAERIGVGSLLNTLHRAGFNSLAREAEHYGLGLALGNGDVTLLELANGFRALANDGLWRPWRWLIGGSSGSVQVDEVRVVSAEGSALVLDILADPVARSPGFGLQTPFSFPFPVAVKTGTSRHFTDNWAVGVTRNFTVAVWAGNFSGEPMQGVSGITGAGPLLNRVVMLTAGRYPPGALRTPQELGLIAARVCDVSGMLATEECPGFREWFIPGTEPTAHDTWVRGNRVVLPAKYAEWSATAGANYVLADGGAGDYDDRTGMGDFRERTGEEGYGFRVVSPLDGDILRIPPGVPERYASVALRAVGEAGAVEWYVNGVRFEGSRWRLVRGEHLFRAVASTGAVAEARVRVE